MVPPKRYSRQRAAVLKAVQKSENHPTAEMIFETVREEIPNVSLGTVYRNLSVLTDEGKIREIIFDDNVKRYEDFMQEHYHCICTKCGDIRDVPINSKELLDSLSSQITDFEISSHRLELYGFCEDCNSK